MTRPRMAPPRALPRGVGVAMTLVLVVATSAPAQTGGGFDDAWNTVDGGGATFSTAPGLLLGGTVGQPDAGRSIGGPYALRGGFWATIVPATLCGDVNGDGAVNIGDALAVAQFRVGLQLCGQGQFKNPDACDVSQPGGCDIGDALAIAQCKVGLISCAFPCNPSSCP